MHSTVFKICWWLERLCKWKRIRLPMRVQSLGRKDPLEESMAIHCTILAWRLPWTEEPGGFLQSTGLQRVRHDWSDLAWRGCTAFWMSNVYTISFCPREEVVKERWRSKCIQYPGPGTVTHALHAGGRWLMSPFTRGLSAWTTATSPGGQVTAPAPSPT